MAEVPVTLPSLAIFLAQKDFVHFFFRPAAVLVDLSLYLVELIKLFKIPQEESNAP
jgi:hypothetical protein